MLEPKYVKIVDEVAEAVFYHHGETTERDRLRRALTMLAEVLVQDIREEGTNDNRSVPFERVASAAEGPAKA